MVAREQTDAFGIFAYVIYICLGGVLVFGFAWALKGAIVTQNRSICRALAPEDRTGEAPEWTVQDLSGNEVSLSDFKGKFVVLNFWATWCEPCITEWPQINQLAERFSESDDIVVIAMSIDQDRESIAPFLDRMSLGESPATVLWDPTQKLHNRYGTEKIPDTYFVDEEGQIAGVFVNVRKWGSPEAYHCVDGTAGR